MNIAKQFARNALNWLRFFCHFLPFFLGELICVMLLPIAIGELSPALIESVDGAELSSSSPSNVDLWFAKFSHINSL